MLCLIISVAALVTLVSTASLPAKSPDANNELFQTATGPSTLGLVSANRLTPSSELNHTVTAKPASLGIIYPPGYPGQSYNYHVPSSQISLLCWFFEPNPRQNAQGFLILFNKVLQIFNDTSHRDDQVWPLTDGGHISWSEGEEEPAETSHLVLVLPRFEEDGLTYEDFAPAIIGLNQMRLAYPMLDIYAKIYKEGILLDLGDFWCYTGEPDELPDSS